MDKTEILAKIAEIGTCEDVTERRTMLTDLSKVVGETYDKLDEQNTTISTLNDKITSNNTEIEKLQRANYNYFLELTANKSDSERQTDNTGLRQEEEKKYKSYDELVKDYLK